jgi:hypothetical protein
VATKAAMTSVECGTREVSEQTQEIRLRGVCPCARPSRLVCFAQAQVRRLRSTSVGCGSRLHVYGARVWRHGAGVCAQDRRHTWAHANAMQPRSCRVTARRCIRGRRIMACRQQSPVVSLPSTDADCKSACAAFCSDRAVPYLPLRYPRPAAVTALAPSVQLTPPLIVLMIAPCRRRPPYRCPSHAFVGLLIFGSCEQTLGLGVFLLSYLTSLKL